jgi:hypothetical protein
MHKEEKGIDNRVSFMRDKEGTVGILAWKHIC